MKNQTEERAVEVETKEDNQEFKEVMEKVATLEPQQQEKVTLFVQGFVAAAEMTQRKAV